MIVEDDNQVEKGKLGAGKEFFERMKSVLVDTRTKSSSSIDGESIRQVQTSTKNTFILESNNLLEDLQIPDSRLIDGDASELALIGQSYQTIPFVYIIHLMYF